MPRLKRFALVAIALTAALVAAGCSDDDDNNPLAPAPGPNVMVVHASPDAGPVDLRVNNILVSAGTALAYPNNTGYLARTAGAENYKVNPAGSMTTVIDTTVTLVNGNNYTVFASDSVANIGAVILLDDLTTPAAGKAHVRFAHFSPNAPAVDVAVQGGPVVFANQSFKDFTDFTPLDAGSYDLEVRLAGQATQVLALNGVTLQAGKIYTVFAKGFVGGAGMQALGAEIIANN